MTLLIITDDHGYVPFVLVEPCPSFPFQTPVNAFRDLSSHFSEGKTRPVRYHQWIRNFIPVEHLISLMFSVGFVLFILSKYMHSPILLCISMCIYVRILVSSTISIQVSNDVRVV